MLSHFKQYILGVITSLTVVIVSYYFFSDRPQSVPSVVVKYKFSEIFDYNEFIAKSFVDGYVKIEDIFKKDLPSNDEINKAQGLFQKFSSGTLGNQYIYDVTIINESNAKVKNLEIINRTAGAFFVVDVTSGSKFTIESGGSRRDFELNPSSALKVNLVSNNAFDFESQFLVLQENIKVKLISDSKSPLLGSLIDFAGRSPIYFFIFLLSICILALLFISALIFWIFSQVNPEYVGQNMLSKKDYSLYRKIISAYELKEKQKKLEQRNDESDK